MRYGGLRTRSSALRAGDRSWRAKPSSEAIKFSMRFRSAAVWGVHPTVTSGGMASPSGMVSTKIVVGKWDRIRGKKVKLE